MFYFNLRSSWEQNNVSFVTQQQRRLNQKPAKALNETLATSTTAEQKQNEYETCICCAGSNSSRL